MDLGMTKHSICSNPVLVAVKVYWVNLTRTLYEVMQSA